MEERGTRERRETKTLPSSGPRFPADAVPEQPSRGQAAHTKSLTSQAINPLEGVAPSRKYNSSCSE